MTGCGLPPRSRGAYTSIVIPRLTLTNRFAYLEDAPLSVVKLLASSTGYLVAGHEHSSAFQNGYWDGKKKLVSLMRDGRVRAPAGLVQEMADIMDGRKLKYDFDDQRRLPAQRISFNEPVGLRPYQQEAIELATTPQGSLGTVGRGIIKMPPRSGKTVMAAGIIARLGVRTLFLVPSLFLLHQAQKELSRWLGVEVGICGDEIWEPREVTVATTQTMLNRRGKATKAEPSTSEYLDLINHTDLLFVDEVHHLEGEEWRKIVQDCDAPYIIGLSATVFLDHDEECELGVIWLRACCGDILIDKSISDLIELGYLVRPDVRLYPVRVPRRIMSRGWSQRLWQEAILRNDYRNDLAVRVTGELVSDGMKVCIISNRLIQVRALCHLLERARLPYAKIVGKTKSEERKRHVSRFKKGDVKVLIGTVFGEGVDIPEIDGVVNAEGGSSVKAAYQRLRCLTPNKGKTRAVMVDFMDLMHPFFAKHSRDRLSVYRSERAFRVSVAS